MSRSDVVDTDSHDHTDRAESYCLMQSELRIDLISAILEITVRFAREHVDFARYSRGIRQRSGCDPLVGQCLSMILNERSHQAAHSRCKFVEHSLLAATFEEFVREMARAYARAVVASSKSIEMLPSRLAHAAWRRTMETLNPRPDW